MNDVFKKLAKKLDELPNGYPATESGVELRILKKIFSPEDAEMALKLSPLPETAQAIAERLSVPEDEIQTILENMVIKGQIGSVKMNGNKTYLLMPFIVGIFEFQLNRLDKELVDMVGEYAPQLMEALGGHSPSLMRVVPINVKIDAQHQVLTYEDMTKIIDSAKSFQVNDCICRKERSLHGKTCSHSLEVCLGLSSSEDAFDDYPRGRVITKDEALNILRTAEEEGLVHSTYNVQNEQMFVCNCCSCCCGIIRGMKYFNAPYLLAKSNFVALIDQDVCQACGVCAEERCPMEAISETEGTYRVNPERCIGCGVCTTTCPTEAISLIRKPDSDSDNPPGDIVDWYFQRAASRGIPINV